MNNLLKNLYEIWCQCNFQFSINTLFFVFFIIENDDPHSPWLSSLVVWIHYLIKTWVHSLHIIIRAAVEICQAIRQEPLNSGLQSIIKILKYNEICTRVGCSHHTWMEEAIHPVQEVRVEWIFFLSSMRYPFSRLKELLEQYKLELPELDFADDNVVERRTVQFRVDDLYFFLKIISGAF